MDKSKIEKIVRGSIWWTNFGYNTVNMHTQKGKRPCIVVSNDKNNFFSPVVNVCPITTKRDDLEMIHPVVYVDGVKSYIMVEQIATIDKANLFTYVGVAEKKTIQTMDKALRLQLNLSTGANELHTKLDMLIETTKRIEENQKIASVVNTEPVKTGSGLV